MVTATGSEIKNSKNQRLMLSTTKCQYAGANHHHHHHICLIKS